MMLSKSTSEEQQQEQEETLQRPTPLPASLVKKKTADDAMADLERRLQMLGPGGDNAPSSTTGSGMTNHNTTATAVAPATAASHAAAAAAMPSKNALLARIKAAQERAKQPSSSSPIQHPVMAHPQPPQPPAPTSFDPMMMTMAPPTAATAAADTFQSQQQHQQPLPSFNAVSGARPSISFDPHAPSSSSNISMITDSSTMNSNAPALDDFLLDHQRQPDQQQHEHLLSMQQQQPMSETATSQHQEEESLESILAALEGLSEEEKQALLAEQGKIMATIEKQKVSSADARANAFEQRSLAGALRAPAARVDESFAAAAAGLTPEEAEQLKADMVLAEQLQKEEYEQAERENSERSERRRRTQQSSSSSPSRGSPQQHATSRPAAHEPGWMEWLGFAAPAPAPPPHLAERRPLQRGEIGVSLPPGTSRRSAGGPAHTSGGGAETITFTPSYDDADRAEDAAFLRNRGSPAARVAERQPLFSCVADSITSAATSLSTALQMTEDDEGNVHGVDSSGLLGRGGGGGGRDSNNNQESTTPYERAG